MPAFHIYGFVGMTTGIRPNPLHFMLISTLPNLQIDDIAKNFDRCGVANS